MKKSKFSPNEISKILKEFEQGKPVEIIEREHSVSRATFYKWRQRYGGMEASDLKRIKELEEENIQIFIGSQADRAFLQQVKAQIPDIDILIDDGGHTMQQQIVSFEELYAKVKPNGIYLCEDTMTSYWLEYGGGLRRRGTFIEYSKNFVDSLHAWHSGQAAFKKDQLTESLASVAFYDGIVVLEKKPREKPQTLQSGQSSFESETPAPKSRGQKWKYQALLSINKVLQRLKLPGFIWR